MLHDAADSHNARPVNVNRSRVAERAYFLWEMFGRPSGRDTMHWRQAEEIERLFRNSAPAGHAHETRRDAQSEHKRRSADGPGDMTRQ